MMFAQCRQIAACRVIAMFVAMMTASIALGQQPGEPVKAEKTETPATVTPPPMSQPSPSLQSPAAPGSPASPTSPISALDDMPSYGEALVRMVVILFSILIALLLLARFLPRWLGKSLAVGRGGTIKVIDSLALEPRKRVYLIQVGGQYFLIGTSETGVHVLADKSLDGERLAQTLANAKGDAAVVPPVSSSTMRSFAAALSAKPAVKEGA